MVDTGAGGAEFMLNSRTSAAIMRSLSSRRSRGDHDGHDDAEAKPGRAAAANLRNGVVVWKALDCWPCIIRLPIIRAFQGWCRLPCICIPTLTSAISVLLHSHRPVTITGTGGGLAAKEVRLDWARVGDMR